MLKTGEPLIDEVRNDMKELHDYMRDELQKHHENWMGLLQEIQDLRIEHNRLRSVVAEAYELQREQLAEHAKKIIDLKAELIYISSCPR